MTATVSRGEAITGTAAAKDVGRSQPLVPALGRVESVSVDDYGRDVQQ